MNAQITIDRLALEIPGFDPAQVSRLTQLVAGHLTPGFGPDVSIPRVTVMLGAADTGVEQIAWAIARAIRAARDAAATHSTGQGG